MDFRIPSLVKSPTCMVAQRRKSSAQRDRAAPLYLSVWAASKQKERKTKDKTKYIDTSRPVEKKVSAQPDKQNSRFSYSSATTRILRSKLKPSVLNKIKGSILWELVAKFPSCKKNSNINMFMVCFSIDVCCSSMSGWDETLNFNHSKYANSSTLRFLCN